MPQPPTQPVLARELVREIPFASQHTFQDPLKATGATFVAEFDIALRVTDNNQLIGGATGAAPTNSLIAPQFAIGTLLDALVFCAGPSTLLVSYAVDSTCLYRPVASIAVPAATTTNISGLRVTGRFVQVLLTIGAGGPFLTEFGAYLRSA